MRRRWELEQSIALEAAKRDIAGRLRPVCPHFSDADFAAFVDRAARIDVKYRLREDWAFAGAVQQEDALG